MKKRIDVLVTESGLAESREKARALIMAGEIFVNGQRADKPGDMFDGDVVPELHGAPLRYVSRGGLKLEKAMELWGLLLDGLICADIGASTGGFTDCMLQNGAARVYAVDVGYGQLAWKLREDKRVIVLEKTNARLLTANDIPEKLDFFSVDVSFISLKLILPALSALCRDGAQGVCLVKPQFEAGRENVGKNGVVRDSKVHVDTLTAALSYASDNGFGVKGITFSPIKGPKGNIEFLLYIEKGATNARLDPENTVRLAHDELDERKA